MGSLKYNDLSSTKAIKYNGDYVAEVKYNGTTIWPHYWDGTFSDTSWKSTLTTSGTTYTYHITTPEQFANAMYSLQNNSTIPALNTAGNSIVFSIEADLYFNRDWKNNFDWEGSTAITNGVKNFLKSYSDVPRLWNKVLFYLRGNYHKIVGYYGYVPTPDSTDKHICCFLSANNYPNGAWYPYVLEYDDINWVNCTFCVQKQGAIFQWIGSKDTNYDQPTKHYAFLNITFQHCKFEQMETHSWSTLGLIGAECGCNTSMYYKLYFANVVFNNCQYKIADGGTYSQLGCLVSKFPGDSGTYNSHISLQEEEYNVFNNVNLTKGTITRFTAQYIDLVVGTSINANGVYRNYYNSSNCNFNYLYPRESTSDSGIVSDHNNTVNNPNWGSRTVTQLSYFPDESIYNIEMTDNNPF